MKIIAKVFLAFTLPYLFADIYIIAFRIFHFNSLGEFLDTIYGYLFVYCLFFIPVYLVFLIYFMLREERRKFGWFFFFTFLIYVISLSRTFLV